MFSADQGGSFQTKSLQMKSYVNFMYSLTHNPCRCCRYFAVGAGGGSFQPLQRHADKLPYLLCRWKDLRRAVCKVRDAWYKKNLPINSIVHGPSSPQCFLRHNGRVWFGRSSSYQPHHVKAFKLHPLQVKWNCSLKPLNLSS